MRISVEQETSGSAQSDPQNCKARQAHYPIGKSLWLFEKETKFLIFNSYSVFSQMATKLLGHKVLLSHLDPID